MKGKIQKLDPEIIKRIAAGEVVQKPISVIKETIENSIDANATKIQVTIKNGGLGLIQIIDNGEGIEPLDFPLLCERHATSKLSEFEDLKSIATYGFRGEALASISYVASLVVSSKRANEDLGYVGNFLDGKLVDMSLFQIGELQPTPMNQGTCLRIERLFYKSNARRNSINANEEFKSIHRLLQSLAIHHHQHSFSLSSGETNIEFKSIGGNKESIFSNIAKVKPSEILVVNKEFPNIKTSYEIQATTLGSLKRGKEVVIFINDRLVSNDTLKKAIDEVYKTAFSSIKEENGAYFVYMNLKMRGDFVDVNVHPTKKIVKFLFEAEITSSIKSELASKLKPSCTVRTISPAILNLTPKVKEAPQNTVRTDSSQRTLEGMIVKEEKNISVGNAEFLENSRLESSEEWTKFIKGVFYVGCLSSNYVLVQNEQSLFLMNTIPITLQTFWQILWKNKGKLESHSCLVNLPKELLSYFAEEMEREMKVREMLEWLQEFSDLLSSEFSVEINPSHTLLSFTSVHSIFPLCSPKQICEIFDRTKNKLNEEVNANKFRLFFSYFLAETLAFSLQYNGIFQEEKEKFDYFFRNFLFQTTKSGFSFNDISKFLTRILSISDVYKIFERC